MDNLTTFIQERLVRKVKSLLELRYRTGQSDINTKTLRLRINKLTVQLNGKSVFQVHTARLGNPSYC